MNKFFVFILALSCLSFAHASKFSEFFNKMDAREKARKEKEMQQDLNFSDFAFRFDRRFTNDRGDQCREYTARSRSNPYRNGRYVICDER